MNKTNFKKALSRMASWFTTLCVVIVLVAFVIIYITITGANISIVANDLRLGGFLDFRFGIEVLFALYGCIWVPLFMLVLANKWIR